MLNVKVLMWRVLNVKGPHGEGPCAKCEGPQGGSSM